MGFAGACGGCLAACTDTIFNSSLAPCAFADEGSSKFGHFSVAFYMFALAKPRAAENKTARLIITP
jgi:hypothetical protein